MDELLQEKADAQALQNINNTLAQKADKITGKGLSVNDYTTREKDKLKSINLEELSLKAITANGVTILTPLDATFSKLGGKTGSIKITLPGYFQNTMLSLKINVYDYDADNKSFSLILGGYVYETKNWLSTSAQIIGSLQDRNFPVRFGRHNNSPIIYIGDLNHKWGSVGAVTVIEAMLSFHKYNPKKWLKT